MSYKVKYGASFEKSFKKLDGSVQKLIAKYIKNYLDNCIDPRKQGKALVGNKKSLWRYKIGDYRLIVEIQDNELIIIAIDIGHRKDIYKFFP